MTASTRIRTAQAAGCALGVALALALIVHSRSAAGVGAVGAEVSVHVNPTGELAVSPAGPEKFLHEPALMPGRSASGSFELTNQTGERLAVRMRALGSQHDLDDSLLVTISSGARPLAGGTLGTLADGGTKPLLLDPGSVRTVEVTVSLPAAVEGAGAAASLVDVALSFRAREAA